MAIMVSNSSNEDGGKTTCFQIHSELWNACSLMEVEKGKVVLVYRTRWSVIPYVIDYVYGDKGLFVDAGEMTQEDIFRVADELGIILWLKTE